MNKAKELRDMLKGKTAPGRVWKMTRLPDGSLKREQLAPESYRADRARKWDKRQVASARHKLGLSQSEFAQLMGVSIDTLQNWEQGRRSPTGAARILLKMATEHPKWVLQAA